MTRDTSHRNPTCALAIAFLEGADAPREGAEGLREDLRAHLATCPDCARTVALHRQGADEFRRATEAVPAGLPALGQVLGALDEVAGAARRRRRLWTIGAGVIVPAAAVLLFVLLRPPVVPPAPGPARPSGALAVTDVRGAVSFGDSSGARHAAGLGPLGEGSDVETGDDGHLTLAEEGVARVSIAPRTHLRVGRWREGSVALALDRGALDAEVQPRAAGQTVEVLTPLARVTVVGTAFTASHSPESGTLVVTRSGVVRVTRLDGTLVGELRAGESLEVRPPAPTPDAVQPDAGATDVTASDSPDAGRTARPRADVRAARVERTEKNVRSEPDPEERARALLAAGDAAGAILALEPLRGPGRQTDPRVLALLGDAYRLAGRDDDAIAAWEGALAAAGDRDLGPVVLDLSELLAARGSGDALEPLWRTYLARHPDGRSASDVRWRLAGHLADAGRADEAAEAWAELLRRDPRCTRAPEALARLGQHLLDGRQPAAAAVLFEAHLDAPLARMAETALVGLMHARAGEGRRDEVVRLAHLYDERFPDGTRRVEVRRLLARIGPPTE